MNELETLLGTLTGTAVAGFAQWVRYDNRTQEKLTNTNNLARDLRDTFLDQQTWGDAVRCRLPVVQDFCGGLALASQTQAAPSAIPSVPALSSRPNLCNGAENAVGSFQWPPRPGVYDERLNVKSIGELSTTALALTYEEVRAAIHAFILCNGSTSAQRVQIYRALNSLAETVAGLAKTKAQYSDVWGDLFDGQATQIDPHRDPSRQPMITAVNTGSGVASVNWITTGSLNESNPQTDNAHRFVVQADGAMGINAGTTVCKIVFATPYQYRKADGTIAGLVPVVQPQGNKGSFFAVASKTGYDLINYTTINPGDSASVVVIVEPGVITT